MTAIEVLKQGAALMGASLVKNILLLVIAASFFLLAGGHGGAGARRRENGRADRLAPLHSRPLSPGATSLNAAEPVKVLVFSKTNGFRHGSITAAVAAFREIGVRNNFVVEATEDGAAFSDANLLNYRAVVFLLTTGDVLDDGQQAAFERFIRRGNGYVGVHSATDTEYGWAWYGGLVGAYFEGHPATQTATVRLEDRQHPSTASLPDPWVRTDEWYNFRSNPRANVRVLARLDEASYSGGTMGDHPIAWCHSYDGGRAWYTAGGHTEESYSEPLFLEHLSGGVLYAAGLNPSAAPTLLTEENLARAVALDSVTFVRDPFSLNTSHNFSPDRRTRVAVFAVDVELAPGESTSALTARAEASGGRIIPLPVEHVGKVEGFGWLTQINLRLPDELANAGEVRVSISLRGVTSNSVVVRLAEGGAP